MFQCRFTINEAAHAAQPCDAPQLGWTTKSLSACIGPRVAYVAQAQPDCDYYG